MVLGNWRKICQIDTINRDVWVLKICWLQVIHEMDSWITWKYKKLISLKLCCYWRRHQRRVKWILPVDSVGFGYRAFVVGFYGMDFAEQLSLYAIDWWAVKPNAYKAPTSWNWESNDYERGRCNNHSNNNVQAEQDLGLASVAFFFTGTNVLWRSY